MKKTTQLLIILVVLVVMSFKTSDELLLKTGKYGICNCDDLPETTAKTELVINDDFTFHYFNNSNPDKKIDVNGKWIRKNNTIYLHDFISNFSIHCKWTIDNNEKCLKSRKGLNFTRLCYLKSCK